MRYTTTAHQAELNAAAKMREWGYIDATSTTGGSDGGIDVRSRRALAQVKWRGGVAGRPDLQRLVGARGNDTTKELIFFSASGYSRQAVDYAGSMAILLYVYDPVGRATPVGRTGLTKRQPLKCSRLQVDPVLVFLGAGLLLSFCLLGFAGGVVGSN